MRQLKITQQITNRNEKSLEKYLNDIGKYHPLTPQEEVEMAIRIQEGDEIALNTLVNGNLRFVVSVAKQYQHLNMTLGDLINEGNIGLVTAAKRFDHTRGFKFISYAVWWIRQSILKAAGENARSIRLPLNQIAQLKKVSMASSAFEQTYLREPTDEELAEELEVTVQKVKETKSAGKRTGSLDKPVVDGELTTLADLVASEDQPAPDQDIMKESLQNEIGDFLNILSDKQRRVIEKYFGLDGGDQMSLSSLANWMGVTSENVRQIRDKALKRLRSSSAKERLKVYLG